jgi:hypothetical protein
MQWIFALKNPIERTATIIHELLHAHVGAGTQVRLPPGSDVNIGHAV